MGVFNVVLDAVTETCPRCGATTRRPVQFTFGDAWQFEYRIGDVLAWGGNDVGRPGLPRVLIDAIAEGCPRCGDNGGGDYVVVVEYDVVRAVVPPDADRSVARSPDGFLVPEPPPDDPLPLRSPPIPLLTPRLRPLGTLGPPPGTIWRAADLARTPVTPVGIRRKVAAYLRACPIFVAWMGYTRDAIGDRFGVAGGESTASDGVYYWRLDGVDYLEEYGIALPPGAVRHFESRSWVPPDFSEEEFERIESELEAMTAATEY